MSTTKFIIVGYGNIGSRHVGLLEAMTGAEVMAIVDLDPAARAAASQRLYPVYPTLEAVVADGIEADVANICTPNGQHYSSACTALEQGFHVLVEKPVTLSAETCNQLIRKAREVNRGLYAVLQNRYSPPARWLWEVMDQQLLGRLFMVQVQCFWNRGVAYYQEREWRGTADNDGGPLYTQFSHFVDLLPWVLGKLNLVDGWFYNFNHLQSTDFEDTGHLRFSLSSGALVLMSYSTAAYEVNLESSITLLGERGSLKIGGQYMDTLAHCHIADYEPPVLPAVNPPNEYGHSKGSAANHAHVFAEVIKAVKGLPHNLPEVKEAKGSIALIETAYQLRDQKGIDGLSTTFV